MKKQTIIAALALGLGLNVALAQQKNVVSAINYLGYYNKDKDANDLIEAKKYIDLATADAESSTKAKTWVKRAEIYMNIYNSKDAKLDSYKEGAFEEAVKAYGKTKELDPKNNYPEAKQGLKVANIIAGNKGVEFFKSGNYAAALSNFESAININKDYFQTVDTNAIYNAALSAELAKNYDKAIQYYQNAIDIKYGGVDKGPTLYNQLAKIYQAQGNNAEYTKTIKKGREVYPNDKDLIITELNDYITAGKYKEAITNLELAIAKEPNNEIFPYNIGVIYDNLANPADPKNAPSEKEADEYFAKAEAAYKRALEVNPDYFDALYNLGALYFNKAVKQSEIVNNIKDNNKYKIESAKVDEIFKKSLPFLEKGEQIRTNDVDTYKTLLSTLNKLYLMTDQVDKAMQIKTRLAKGPNGIQMGDELASVEEKLGKPLKNTPTKGKYYVSETLDYPEYILYMDGGQLTKWVKK